MLGAMLDNPRASWLPKVTQSLGAGLRHLVSAQCPVCEIERGDPVCDGCLQDFFDASEPRCLVCAGRLPAPRAVSPAEGGATEPARVRCGRCLARPAHFDRTIALGDYAPPLDGMVTAFKSGARLDLARVFGLLLAARARSLGPIGAIVPVPLSAQRMRARGFNQSLEMARTIGRSLNVPVLRQALVRRLSGPPQQALPLPARRRNVRGAFSAPRALAAKSVALIDDVMTSGATLDEAARTLKAAGAGPVVNLIVARTPVDRAR